MNNNFNLSSLSTNEIKELWSKTYNRDGKPDWSHIFPYYREEIVFKDTIQKIVGIDEFKNLCKRLTARCQQLKMNIPSIVKEDNIIFMEWEMTMIFKKYPSSTIYGTTRLTLHQDGRIIEQRDYYDLWGDIFDNIPWFAKPYRRFLKKKFG
jgi:limonene-1,2-epoxide hydrolase